MEQRSLRLGDIVDDYCPRERRVTNHAIVAIVGDTIKQTRCTTCEAEHEYKEARTPRRKGKNGESDLAAGILVSNKPQSNGQAHDVVVEVVVEEVVVQAPAGGNGNAVNHADGAGNGEAESGEEPTPDAWLAHRPLIRATLPKTEADPPPVRPIPEFTMHQRQGRGFGGGGRGGYRHGFSGFGGNNGQGGGGNVSRDPNGQPDGNRAPRPGGKSRHRRRHRRPR